MVKDNDTLRFMTVNLMLAKEVHDKMDCEQLDDLAAELEVVVCDFLEPKLPDGITADY